MRALRGLYVITDSALAPHEVLAGRVAAALEGGASMVQYRDKHTDADTRRENADALLKLCRAHGAPFIINDDVALAAAAGADGVHLGRDDADPAAARRTLGAHALIGVSCYDDLARAAAAQEAGADYVAFGRFFPSHTKPHAGAAPVGLLARARAALRIPIVAIGGITPGNGAALIEAGADMLAAVHGIFGQPDTHAAARAYAALFASPRDAA